MIKKGHYESHSSTHATKNHLNHIITKPYPNHLISRGLHTALDRELGYHASCTFYKG
jgi:hypothetical protein